MPKTWFYASYGLNKISPVHVEKETADFVFLVGGRRSAKTAEGAYYRPTFQEAKVALLAHYQGLLEREEVRVEYLKKNLAIVQSITQ